MSTTGKGSRVSEGERQVRLEIPSSPEAPRKARLALHEIVADHPLAAGELDTLTLLVSEVVTNAVTHPEPAADDIEVSIVVTPRLTRVVVSDRGCGFDWSAAALPPGRSDGGYGIMLLDGQASRWGTLGGPGRFSVWFELDHRRAA
jgi:anti-sigma regulatory factor (Ser/Thr protein kinase)